MENLVALLRNLCALGGVPPLEEEEVEALESCDITGLISVIIVLYYWYLLPYGLMHPVGNETPMV
jgi:hypothetical protein